MKVAFIASECFPYVKTGGLGDVAGALPKYLEEAGCEVRLFVPLYGGIKVLDHGIKKLDELSNIPIHISEKDLSFSVFHAMLPESKVEIFFIDCPYYFHRDMPYTNDVDEDERFILFQNAVLMTMQRMKWSPEIIHCNDWQTGLIPVYLKTNYAWDKLFENTRSVISVHNIGYQGRFPEATVLKTGLNDELYNNAGPLEFHSTFSFLKAGLVYADKITTVSPTYALEIQTKEYGAGLEGVLLSRNNDLVGILNGIDTEHWNPKTDKFIKHHYSAETLEIKEKNKKDLLERIEFEYVPNEPVLGIISRLAGQKGIDLFEPIMNNIMSLPVKFVVLGSGEKRFEKYLATVQASYPGRFCSYLGYSNELSHLITAGADIFLMPSKYEPCGLNQMYSLRYGTVPLVRKTGGLADTVMDYHEYYEKGNGFSFNDYTSTALMFSIQRAVDIFFQKEKWEGIQRRGMIEDFSWNKSAGKYLEVYNNLI